MIGSNTILFLFGTILSCFSYSEMISKTINHNDIQYVDFDSNLIHPDLFDDMHKHMQTAIAHGVSKFIVPGSNLLDSRQAIDLSISNELIFATAGIHPYNAESTQLNAATTSLLNELTAHPNCLAIGECGLDYSIGFPSKEFQIPWFKIQLERALELKKPLYLHTRESEIDFISILQEYGFGYGLPPPVEGVVHCFTGTTSELDKLLGLGFSIGLTGHIFKLEQEILAEWLSKITLNRLVIETDAPYMGFKGCRGTELQKKGQKYPNVPASLGSIAAHISSVSGWTLSDVAHATFANSIKFLRR